MNTGQTGYVHWFTTAFTDPDDNYKQMSITPNNTVYFTGTTNGAYLQVTAPPVETTTKIDIKGIDIYGADIMQFCVFTVIPRQVWDTLPNSVFEYNYDVAAAAL